MPTLLATENDRILPWRPPWQAPSSIAHWNQALESKNYGLLWFGSGGMVETGLIAMAGSVPGTTYSANTNIPGTKSGYVDSSGFKNPKAVPGLHFDPAGEYTGPRPNLPRNPSLPGYRTTPAYPPFHRDPDRFTGWGPSEKPIGEGPIVSNREGKAVLPGRTLQRDLVTPEFPSGGGVLEFPGIRVGQMPAPSTLNINPNYEIKPIAGGKFGLFNKDGTPVVEKGQKIQQPFNTQEEAAKWLDLASDPAVGRLRPDEAKTALRVETQEGVNLRRYTPPPGGKGDWVDANGIVYDGCSPAPSAHFAKQWNNFRASLADHLSKVDKVVVDLTGKGLTPSQVKQVVDHINALPEVDKSKIVLLP